MTIVSIQTDNGVGETVTIVGNGLGTESPSVKVSSSITSFIVADDFMYIVSSDGTKGKIAADAAQYASAFFGSDGHLCYDYTDFADYALDVEYDSKTLTFSGISKELFVSYIHMLDDVGDQNAFADSITEFSYTLELRFNAENKLLGLTEKYVYTANDETRTIITESAYSDSAEVITLPEDAEDYVEIPVQ